MSRSHANPPGTQDQQGDLDSRPVRDALETLQANTNEVEALRLTNRCLLRDLEELTRQMQRPQEEQQHHDNETRIDPHEGTERTDNDLQRDKATLGTAWAHLSPSYSSDIHLGNSPR